MSCRISPAPLKRSCPTRSPFLIHPVSQPFEFSATQVFDMIHPRTSPSIPDKGPCFVYKASRSLWPSRGATFSLDLVSCISLSSPTRAWAEILPLSGLIAPRKELQLCRYSYREPSAFRDGSKEIYRPQSSISRVIRPVHVRLIGPCNANCLGKRLQSMPTGITEGSSLASRSHTRHANFRWNSAACSDHTFF